MALSGHAPPWKYRTVGSTAPGPKDIAIAYQGLRAAM